MALVGLSIPFSPDIQYSPHSVPTVGAHGVSTHETTLSAVILGALHLRCNCETALACLVVN